MKTFAFHLQKGGVGKTTLSGTMAYELSLKGKTILIDCDPQGNSSDWFISDFQYELTDVLTGKMSVDDAIVNVTPNFDILPTRANKGLKLYGETKLNDEPFIFVDLFEELDKLGYDYVICDLSPGIGRLEKSVLTACDEVITPMTPEHFSIKGVTNFAAELHTLKKAMRRGADHLAIIINAFDGRIGQHCEITSLTVDLKHSFVTVPVDPVFRKSQRKMCAPQAFGGMKKETTEAIEKIGGLLCR